MLKLDRVLHVEDEPNLRLLMHELFGREWAIIHDASSIQEAIARIEEQGNNYQLIILDLGLEDSAGIDTVRMIRACSSAPIVVHTGEGSWTSGEYEEMTRELGVYGIIEKSTFSVARIRAIIENAVRTAREEALRQDVQEIKDEFTKYRRQMDIQETKRKARHGFLGIKD